MKQIICSLLMVAFYLASFGQTDKCGFKLSKGSKTDFLNQLASDRQLRVLKDSTLVIEVPVVFHVIHDQDDEFVGDERIKQELADLIRDFQLLNTSELNTLPANFREVVGNADIRFKLADRDEQGNPTSGIIRTNATRNVYNFKKQIFAADKMWNPAKYMNVYIGNIRNGKTRGYVNAYPWQNTSSDAIGLYFADIGRSTRLLTHEAGHWFGLWHITEGKCSAQNDGINDTPKQATFTNGCPTTKSECDNDCMFKNYMDYSSCRIMFTKGQVKRMHEVALKFRPTLIKTQTQ